MGRLLVCLVVFLPLCLTLQDQRNARESGGGDGGRREGLVRPPVASPLEGIDLLRLHCVASLGSQSQAGFPGTLAWASLSHVGDQGFEYLFQERPWEFLQMCLDRYEREVQGYTTMFRKRERVDGKLLDEEIVECFFKEKPFSILMIWHKGMRRAKKAMFVDGENNGKMLALPAPPLHLLGVVTRDADGEDAKRSGRYFINQFGMKIGAERTVRHMLQARERDKLEVTYLGITEVPELGDRPCYTFVRSKYDPPEEDGVAELTVYIDMDTWLQVGSVVKDTKGDLIGEYFFRDVKLNPQFAADQFTRKKL